MPEQRCKDTVAPGGLEGIKAAVLPRALASTMSPPRIVTRASIRYVRGSFWVPLASRLRQDGLEVDRETANVAVRRWLREVANARIHGKTGEVPQERLEIERAKLSPLPPPYPGKSVKTVMVVPRPIVGIQHPLTMYDSFAGVAA